jgi:hypothetical protein
MWLSFSNATFSAHDRQNCQLSYKGNSGSRISHSPTVIVSHAGNLAIIHILSSLPHLSLSWKYFYLRNVFCIMTLKTAHFWWVKRHRWMWHCGLCSCRSIQRSCHVLCVKDLAKTHSMQGKAAIKRIMITSWLVSSTSSPQLSPFQDTWPKYHLRAFYTINGCRPPFPLS